MQKETYGFVYIWRDRKNNRFYIGCHWGREDDGYICSSNWMRMAYKRRPQDFKRRVLKRIDTNCRDLLIEEQKWLNLVPKEELGKRYYNFNKHVLHNAWWSDPERAKTTKGRISQKVRKAYDERGSEYIEKMSIDRKRLLSEHPEIIEKQRQTILKKYALGEIQPHNRGHTGGTNPEHSERLKRMYASGEIVPWNKCQTPGATDAMLKANRRIAENKKKTYDSPYKRAKQHGDTFYEGKLCNKHNSKKRYTVTGNCVNCQNENSVAKKLPRRLGVDKQYTEEYKRRMSESLKQSWFRRKTINTLEAA